MTPTSGDVVCEHLAGRAIQGHQASFAELGAANRQNRCFEVDICDPAQVRITPQNAEASVVEIQIDYHPETTVDGSALLTNLVEVGAFVNNGVWYSAPGFVADFTLANEERTYDGNGQLVEIVTNGNYVHPNLL